MADGGGAGVGVYSLEPATEGKVVLATTHGELEVELWSKEAPKACRSFVQHCLDGYYDGTPFHRVIPDFMVQGGDPTGTGTGGEAAGGAPLPHEFHQRLRFTRRGLVGLANAGSADTNGSQFFVTLGRADWLNRKHTIFGRVVGASVYNLLQLAQVETDPKTDRPLDPLPAVLRTEVPWNPFPDVVATAPAPRAAPEEEEGRPRKRRRERKNLKLLSFADDPEAGDDDEEEEEKATVAPALLPPPPPPPPRPAQAAAREAAPAAAADGGDDGSDGDGPDDFDARMRAKVHAKRLAEGTAAGAGREAAAPPPPDPARRDPPPPPPPRAVERAAYKDPKERKRRRAAREQETLAKLAAFQKGLLSGGAANPPAAAGGGGGASGARSGHAGVSRHVAEGLYYGAGEDGEDDDWRNHTLKFDKERRRPGEYEASTDDYVLVDPLLEKEKAKAGKAAKRMREWAGGGPLT